MLDKRLSFDEHIQSKMNTYFKMIGIIKKLSLKIPRDTLLRIYKSFIRPTCWSCMKNVCAKIYEIKYGFFSASSKTFLKQTHQLVVLFVSRYKCELALWFITAVGDLIITSSSSQRQLAFQTTTKPTSQISTFNLFWTMLLTIKL